MKKQKRLKWVAWFADPVMFRSKKEMKKFCKGKSVMTSKIPKL